MNETSSKPLAVPQGNLLVGYIGLNAVPLLILADSLLAIRRGWHPRTAGALGLLVYLSAFFVGMTLLMLAMGPLRRYVRRRAPSFWVMSFAVLIGWLLANVGIVATLRPPPFHLRTPGVRYTFAPDPYSMPGVFGTANYEVNSQGLRGGDPPADGDVYRVLCVGGGATENVYIDQPETWPIRLMEMLNGESGARWWCATAGQLDLATADHARFLETSPRVKEFDCVVLMPGANDLACFVLGLPTAADAAPYWYRSPLFNTAKIVWNAVLRKGYYVDETGEHLTLLRLGRHIPARELDFDRELQAYEQRLRRSVAAAKAAGVRLVLVTHPVLWDYFLTSQASKRLWLARMYPYPREWQFLNAADLLDVMDRYNAALIEVARSEGVEYIDAADRLNGSELLFYDDFHLNDEGCLRFAELLAEYFRSHPGE